MFSGIYSAASAMDAIMQNHDVVAQNLAHATVPGYRRRGLTFEVAGSDPSGKGGSGGAKQIQGPRPGRIYSSFEAGSLEYTGNPLDLAIKGDGFFVVQGPKGTLYTRNGSFQIGANGQLQTKQGLPVQTSSGSIQLPPDITTITVEPDGTLMADKTKVGQIKLVKFADPKQLEPAGTTLFNAPANVQPQAAVAKVEQGYREGSNVQIVNELVSMIAGMRHYEALQRALHAISDAAQQNTRPQSS
jgi:flagellar basal-body rod protein FlgF